MPPPPKKNITANTANLVSHVKDGDVAAGLEDVGELLPLFEGRVHAGRVVRAGVKQHGRASVQPLLRQNKANKQTEQGERVT